MKTLLCILDGWGYRKEEKDNAVNQGKTPNWDSLLNKYTNTLIKTNGLSVGLEGEQMGNSEVGHTNIGAGRVVFQDLPKISNAIADGSMLKIEVIQEAITKLKASSKTMHIFGLISEGGVHSHVDHVIYAIEIFAKEGINVVLHGFTDGRDTPPQGSVAHIENILKLEEKYPNFKIATITGRYYAMDRDNRWERTKLAYDAMVSAKASVTTDFVASVKESYKEGVTDEFIIPLVSENYKGFAEGDSIFCLNFRADRVRQITKAFLFNDFDGFETKPLNLDCCLGLTSYSKEHDKHLKTVFAKEDIKNTLGEVVSKAGLKQLRVAETEKYPHVTFFFNGGAEANFENEDRKMVASPKVATYDLQPEMSAFGITDIVEKAVLDDEYDFILVNYANGDMVGHTGVLEAAIKAVESVDECIGRLYKACKEKGVALILVADHGNCEEMWDYKNNLPHTAHTTNEVQLILANSDVNKLEKGALANIAPTVLEIMNIEQPKEMTAKSLIAKS